MVMLENVKEFQTKSGKAIEYFLSEKGKRSEDTAKSYRGDIKAFLSDVYGKQINTITDVELESLDYDSFKTFLDTFYKAQSNSKFNRMASSIKSLYKYLNKMKAIQTDMQFFDLIEKLPNDAKSYEAIPMEVVAQYIEATRFEKNDQAQKKMIIKAAVETGLRESELLNWEWSNFKVDGEKVLIKGMGKGNKKYTEVISKDFYNELLTLKTEKNKKVFTLSRKNIHDMMARLKKQLRHDDRNYTFHSFKKTAVTNTYKITGSITDAQRKGKHTRLETTQLYLEEEELKMTGYYSLEGKINHNLYKEVPYEVLIQALSGMQKELLFSLNMKLQK